MTDLKNTSDDAIPAYLNSLKFRQSHTLTDTRLALGYTAFAICAATFYWDYKFGFDNTKLYTTIAVALYTLLNGALTFWIFYVEKGTVYVGHNKWGDKIQITSKTEKNKPIYNLTIKTFKKENPEKPHVVTLKKPFTQWFDGEGSFVPLPFQQMFASNVPVIGVADPDRVVEEKKKVKVDEGKSSEEKWAALLAESQVDDLAESSGTPSVAKAKKRAKKA
jgi:hypothetical protein